LFAGPIMSDPWAPGPSAQWACVGLGGRAGSALKRAYDLLLPSPLLPLLQCPLLLLLAARVRGGGKARHKKKLARHRRLAWLGKAHHPYVLVVGLPRKQPKGTVWLIRAWFAPCLDWVRNQYLVL